MGSTGGAYVVLLTAPCFNSGEQPNGTPWPEDDPARLARYNELVRQVAAEHPATVRVEDFGAMVCPGGVYTTTRDGVQLRDGDGVHIVPTPAAGQWLAAHLLPTVVGVGRLQMAGRSLVRHPASHHRAAPAPRSRRPAPPAPAPAGHRRSASAARPVRCRRVTRAAGAG